MKLSFALALSTFGLATATQLIDSASDSISASSRVGRSLLSRARRLDGNNDFSWVTNYSIKFEKCATSHDYYGGYFGGQGNNNNNNNNRNGYNGMYEQRLVHFKLCPSDSCASSCENGADYVVDMNEFVNAYMESKMDAQEYNCERVRENCYCDDANDDQACEYQCYLNAGLDYCDMGDNNNQNQNGQQQFDVQEALECRRLEVDEDAMNYYAYQNGMGNQYNNNNQRMEFFVGPYCSSNGKNIFLGVFMDETCSYEAPDGIYSKLNYGAELPYSKKSLIDNNCVSCKEPQEYDENNNGDQQDADQVLEVCERLYEEAGKCESDIEVSNANGGYFYPNTMACEFIKGLKASGKTRLAMPHVSVTPKVLAGVFAATTAILAGVSYHLHKKMQRGNVQLADQGGQMS